MPSLLVYPGAHDSARLRRGVGAKNVQTGFSTEIGLHDKSKTAKHQELLDKAEAEGGMGEGATGGDVAEEGGAIEEEEEETAKKGENAAPVGGHNLVELDGYTMRWRPVLGMSHTPYSVTMLCERAS